MFIFKRLFCYFFDGTKFSLTRLDELQRDDGYIHVIENDAELMCSSHSIKRFFKAFSYLMIWLFFKTDAKIINLEAVHRSRTMWISGIVGETGTGFVQLFSAAPTVQTEGFCLPFAGMIRRV